MAYRPQWAMRYREGLLHGEPWVQAVPGFSISGGSLAASETIRDIPIALDRTAEYLYLCAIATHVAGNPLAVGIMLRDCYGNPLSDDFLGVAEYSFPGGAADRGGGYAAVFEPPIPCPRGGVLLLDITNFDAVASVIPNLELRGFKMLKRCA